MRHYIQNAGFSLRLLAKLPATALLCIFVLASCIALTASMFKLGHMALFSELSYREPGRIVYPLKLCFDGKERVTTWNFKTAKLLIDRENEVFSDMGNLGRIRIDGQVYESEDSAPQELMRVVTPGYFEATDVHVIEGREFTDNDTPEHLVSLLARRGVICAVIGLGLGIIGAIALSHALFVRLTTLNDGWLVYAAVGTFLIVISIVAILVPAIRGAMENPARNLRDE
jgi:hypothetical protein